LDITRFRKKHGKQRDRLILFSKYAFKGNRQVPGPHADLTPTLNAEERAIAHYFSLYSQNQTIKNKAKEQSHTPDSSNIKL
jgi:hypothetical protein